MEQHTFIGRQSELNALNKMFIKSLSPKCQVCFITGVAGEGKTTLAEYFSEYANENYRDVVAVVGRCNAQTGQNDTYLPFREIMGQFTGIQAKMVYGAINKKSANWPSSLGYGAAKALIEYGPDLIGTFVPGSALITRATLSVADQAIKKQLETRGDSQEIKKEKIRTQYLNVIQELAKKYSLILILDDLQWADETSLDLLLYLCRNLKKSRVFIICTYRSDDVALGRDGSAHPLEHILSEIKSEFGNVLLDLSKNREKFGEKFVTELLEAHKCKVGETFVTEFYNRTRGLPLFAVELLRDLQDREILIQDDGGNWLEIDNLDWNKLPAQLAKLDGLIESRLNRLSPELREILNLASIEGQDFTAQVMMQLLQTPERQLLRKLSNELGKQHNLVSEIREIRVGNKVLSKYRFLNSTFQQYIYDDMSLGERRVLHADVAQTLELLYGDNAKDVAVNLARHYEHAYQPEKVVEYLNIVAEQYSLVSEYKEAQSNLEKALSIAKTENDKRGMVDSLRNFGSIIHIKKGEYDEAQEKFQEALSIARQIKYIPGEIHTLRQLGIIARRKGYLTTAAKYNLDSLALARQDNDKRSVGRALNNLSVVAMDDSAYLDAQKYLEERLEIAEEINDVRGKLSALINFGDLYVRQGLFLQAHSYLESAKEICEQVSSKSQMIEVNTLLAQVRAVDNRSDAKELFSQALISGFDAGETPRVLDGLTAIAKFFFDCGFPEQAQKLALYVIQHPKKSLNNNKRASGLIQNYKGGVGNQGSSVNLESLQQIMDLVEKTMSEIE